ncbi:MAG: sugar transferase [Candidatus Doudnabacteria bacterium]|nr:sugar transferase [Candidatus Doudnabacteria bacterium]
MNWYRNWGKRCADVVTAAIGLIVLSPLLGVVALLVLIKLGRPILFEQERPGKDEAIFTLYKFRTMRDAYDKNGEPLADAERLTRFGTFLRSTSLDELPELWNILRGDMSFVGPRPLLIEYLKHYSKTENQRHTVRPGLTGLAQINGRNATTWKEKFAHDVAYTKAISPSNDLRILLRTIDIVLKRDGINAEGSVTIEKFTGHTHGSH